MMLCRSFGQTHHQGRLALVVRNHAREQLQRRDKMPVMGLRMHIAVAGGRKRLDAEIEIIDVGPAGHVGDRLISDPVEARENRVKGDEHQRSAGDESRPGGGHAAMADVAPEAEMKAFTDDDFAAAKSDDLFVRLSLFPSPEHLPNLLNAVAQRYLIACVIMA